MDSLPKRKQNRLTGYDYSQPGCYFVTICSRDREHLFGCVVGADVLIGPYTIGPLDCSLFKTDRYNSLWKTVWQRGYHDHIIRSEADYLRIWDYIDTNPAKWREDCYYCQAERTILP